MAEHQIVQGPGTLNAVPVEGVAGGTAIPTSFAAGAANPTGGAIDTVGTITNPVGLTPGTANPTGGTIGTVGTITNPVNVQSSPVTGTATNAADQTVADGAVTVLAANANRKAWYVFSTGAAARLRADGGTAAADHGLPLADGAGWGEDGAGGAAISKALISVYCATSTEISVYEVE